MIGCIPTRKSGGPSGLMEELEEVHALNLNER